MSSTDDITDEALRPILAPGERPLYRALAQLVPAQVWKRFTSNYFYVYCSLVVTTHRFLVLRRKVHWFSNEFTTETIESLAFEQISRISNFGSVGRHTLTVHRADGVRQHFVLRAALVGDEAQWAFVPGLLAHFSKRELPRE